MDLLLRDIFIYNIQCLSTVIFVRNILRYVIEYRNKFEEESMNNSASRI